MVKVTRVFGSLKTCSAPITENSPVMTTPGTISGSLICRASCNSLQPSIRAAS